MMEQPLVGRWVKGEFALKSYAELRGVELGEAAHELQILLADGEIKARGLKPNDAAFDVFEVEVEDEEEIRDRWSTEQSPRPINRNIFIRAKIDWEEGDVLIKGARYVADIEIDVLSIEGWTSLLSNKSSNKGGANKKYTDMQFAVHLTQYMMETKGRLPETQEDLIGAIQERWVLASETVTTSWGPGRSWMQERVKQIYDGLSSLEKKSR